MKALIASLTALGLIAAPAVAQTNTAAPAKPAHASKPMAKEAKAEGESTATEAKEHKMAAAHHAKKSMHKASTKKASDATTNTTGK